MGLLSGIGSVRSRFLALALRRGKVTPRKLLSFASARARYRLRSERGAALPSVLIAELTNLCNLRCLHCREDGASPVDYLGGGPPIAVGTMEYALYDRVLSEASPSLLAAVLYVSGEPLLHRDLARMVRRATELRVPTVLSTNGMLLDGTASKALLEAGIDLVKVVTSGHSQEVYGKMHRGGDVERLKANLAGLSRARREGSSPAVVVVDYIRFPHNEHEIGEMRRFCEGLGFLFTVRRGFTVGDEEAGKSALAGAREERIRRTPCDWLWTILTVGWHGKVLACANETFSSRPRVLADLAAGTSVAEAWNGEPFRRLRRDQLRGGRGNHPLCRNCHYAGLDFQY
jgi:MoaA/NifB/PqqE/SkfB family radical SAM enzyme